MRTKDGASQKELLHSIHNDMYFASILVVGLSALAIFVLFEDEGEYSNNQRDWGIQAVVYAAGFDFNDIGVDCGSKNKAWRYFGSILIGLV